MAQSRLVPALKLAPSDSSSSPILSESRVGVPSSSMRSERLAVPGSAGGIGGVAAVDQQREVDDRRGVALGQHDLQAVGKRRLLHRRQLERHGLAQGRRFGAVELGVGLQVGRDTAALQARSRRR